jgi:hypothetical protein
LLVCLDLKKTILWSCQVLKHLLVQ